MVAKCGAGPEHREDALAELLVAGEGAQQIVGVVGRFDDAAQAGCGEIRIRGPAECVQDVTVDADRVDGRCRRRGLGEPQSSEPADERRHAIRARHGGDANAQPPAGDVLARARVIAPAEADRSRSAGDD